VVALDPSTVGVIAKPQPAGVLPLLGELLEWLDRRGIRVVLDPEAARLAGGGARDVAEREELPEKADLLVVLGGDGTLLSVARHLYQREVPILGVNLGSLGFLTEISTEEMIPALQACLEGRAELERRMMLQCTLSREGEALATYHCLNDVVINKGALARMFELRVDVGDLWLTNMRSDGLIVATPTGSTAYNLSAGGPIVVPGLDGLIVSPLCPHTLTMRPLIVDGQHPIRVRLVRESGQVYLTADGQTGHPMIAGDEVRVARSPHAAPLVVSPSRNYFALLREKLGWGSGHS
jgi:NAD+ kinase